MTKVLDFSQASVAPAAVGVGRGMRELSIEAALVWAFATERSGIDFAEERDPDSYAGSGSADSVWTLMKRGRLGCRVDGGGYSEPHDDAQMISSQVAALSQGSGGRKMALQVAELARVGMRPDWMEGARPRCVPKDWRENQHGPRAVTEDAEALGVLGWKPVPRRNRKGVIVYDKVDYCPVIYTPSARTIAAARRNYLQWWGALLEVGAHLRLTGVLSCITITDEMPPLHPWRAGRSLAGE